MITSKNLCYLIFLSTVLSGSTAAQSTKDNATFSLRLSRQDVTVIVGENLDVNIELSGILQEEISVEFSEQHDDYVIVEPQTILIPPNPYNESKDYAVTLSGVRPGRFELPGKVFPQGLIDDGNLFLRIRVAMSSPIIHISLVIGWMYFVAWSISFWPQIYINFKRKSVVGLSFDFLALNFLGHTLYALFNLSLYWCDYIEQEYFDRNPRGLNPVIANDVGFSIHATIATAFTVFQCFIYERGEQRVSYTARSILVGFFVVIIVSAILAGTTTIHWLDFLYIISYIKLAITLIKYVPQAIMNYRRKSTSGWSIENILLDFTGGMLSMLQMLLNAYNYDDWGSLFGDPTKFGLGLFSVLFDIVFIIQHYVLYKDTSKKSSEDSSKTESA